MTEIALVDMGSTRVKWQVRTPQGAIVGSGTNSQPEGCVRALESLAADTPIGVVWLARVGPSEREATFQAAWASRGMRAPVHAVRTADAGPRGLRIEYAAGELGVDRYCALVAARMRSDSPVVVVDAGTAVTLDLLRGDGLHAGGYLLPGRQLGWEVLQTRLADRIAPRDGSQWPRVLETAPGLSSAEALERGWGLGLAGALDRLLGQARDQLGPQSDCWLTGGDACWLAALLRERASVVPNLVLEGLWALSQWRETECAG